jgi:hypothetical protein
MTLLSILNVLTPCFTLQTCVMLCTQKNTILIYTANVFSSGCTTIWVTSHHNTLTLLFVTSVSGSQAHATSRSSELHTDQSHTSHSNTACSVFAFVVNTRDTTTVFLWKANAVNALLVNWARMQRDLAYPLKCH